MHACITKLLICQMINMPKYFFSIKYYLIIKRLMLKQVEKVSGLLNESHPGVFQ